MGRYSAANLEVAEPINAGRLARALNRFVVWAQTTRYLRWLWTSQRGLPSMFVFVFRVKEFSNLAEAHAMQFISQHTSNPVPKVHCAFVHQGRTYISKRRILEQLRGKVSQLRALPAPEGVGVANVKGGRIFDSRLPSKLFWGPFSTIRDFHKELSNGIDSDTKHKDAPPDLQELLDFYRQADDKPVFTQGDLSSPNVLVRGDDVVGIIDWEMSVWFPSYWENTSAWFVNFQNPFWQQEVDNFLTPMLAELRAEDIRRKYFGEF